MWGSSDRHRSFLALAAASLLAALLSLSLRSVPTALSQDPGPVVVADAAGFTVELRPARPEFLPMSSNPGSDPVCSLLQLAPLPGGAPTAPGESAYGWLIGVPEPAPRFELYAATPNPFRSSTTLRFDVPSTGARARLDVFDVGGRRITTLEDRWLDGGEHVAQWDGTDAGGRSVGPGLYFGRLQIEGSSRTSRLLRVR